MCIEPDPPYHLAGPSREAASAAAIQRFISWAIGQNLQSSVLLSADDICYACPPAAPPCVCPRVARLTRGRDFISRQHGRPTAVIERKARRHAVETARCKSENRLHVPHHFPRRLRRVTRFRMWQPLQCTTAAQRQRLSGVKRRGLSMRYSLVPPPTSSPFPHPLDKGWKAFPSTNATASSCMLRRVESQLSLSDIDTDQGL